VANGTTGGWFGNVGIVYVKSGLHVREACEVCMCSSDNCSGFGLLPSGWLLARKGGPVG